MRLSARLSDVWRAWVLKFRIASWTGCAANQHLASRDWGSAELIETRELGEVFDQFRGDGLFQYEWTCLKCSKKGAASVWEII